jgi:nucleotide-binding universal stress UspA family protein
MPLDVTLLHACPSAEGWASMTPALSASPAAFVSRARAAGRALLQRCRRLLPRTCHVEKILTDGSPSTHIVRAAEAWHADLIVLGVNGRDPCFGERVGNTAEFVARRAPCPVMTVHSGRPAAKSTVGRRRNAGRHDGPRTSIPPPGREAS